MQSNDDLSFWYNMIFYAHNWYNFSLKLTCCVEARISVPRVFHSWRYLSTTLRYSSNILGYLANVLDTFQVSKDISLVFHDTTHINSYLELLLKYFQLSLKYLRYLSNISRYLSNIWKIALILEFRYWAWEPAKHRFDCSVTLFNHDACDVAQTFQATCLK